MLRPCLDCGTPTQRTRCPEHTAAFESRRPSRRVKGRYDAKWMKLREIAIRQHPWCANCHTPGDEGNPLTGDHIVPLAWGGKNVMSNVQVLCRRCNAGKRDRMLAPTEG